MSGPLTSLKVIEMVGLGPAPLAGQLLADLGAEVIVIDRKSGMDISKEVNRRGKKSIALNLKDKKGIEVAHKLIAGADILLEGFRPGVMERLHLGPTDCDAINPRLIYGRMTGWGQQGPLSHSAGHDINYLAVTGALHAIGKKGEPPIPPLNLAADYGGGSMFLVMGILSAIIERGISGKGQVVDAAMVDGVPAMMGLIQTMVGQGFWTNNREDNFLDTGAPWYRCYKTSDEKFVSVGAIEPQFFAELISLLELDETLLKQQNDKAQWPAMHTLFEEIFGTKTRDEWAKLFEGTDACVAPVLNFQEAEAYPHNAERNVFFNRNGITQTSVAPRLSRSISDVPKAATQTGADGKTLLSDIGVSENEINSLASSGVLL
ncbi:MAG: CaiB/BaiF CoA-transferase family protein [Rhizobiaceae bacterium]|nr:CaiB/BaiF CoA-transferase family protein [Rhizobiaceae bacterium]